MNYSGAPSAASDAEANRAKLQRQRRRRARKQSVNYVAPIPVTGRSSDQQSSSDDFSFFFRSNTPYVFGSNSADHTGCASPGFFHCQNVLPVKFTCDEAAGQMDAHAAAVKIQAAFRGFILRKYETLNNLRLIAEIKTKIAAFRQSDMMNMILSDEIETFKHGELIRHFLDQLLEIQGISSLVIADRNEVIEGLLILQEIVNGIITNRIMDGEKAVASQCSGTKFSLADTFFDEDEQEEEEECNNSSKAQQEYKVNGHGVLDEAGGSRTENEIEGSSSTDSLSRITEEPNTGDAANFETPQKIDQISKTTQALEEVLGLVNSPERREKCRHLMRLLIREFEGPESVEESESVGEQGEELLTDDWEDVKGIDESGDECVREEHDNQRSFGTWKSLILHWIGGRNTSR